jgi:hypothetical protein
LIFGDGSQLRVSFVDDAAISSCGASDGCNECSTLVATGRQPSRFGVVGQVAGSGFVAPSVAGGKSDRHRQLLRGFIEPPRRPAGGAGSERGLRRTLAFYRQHYDLRA